MKDPAVVGLEAPYEVLGANVPDKDVVPDASYPNVLLLVEDERVGAACTQDVARCIEMLNRTLESLPKCLTHSFLQGSFWPPN